MRKLKAEIIDKLIAVRATSAEIDFVIWLSHYQNDAGLVRGVHYKDVCKELQMAPQTFYNVKESLQRKGIIEVQKDASFYAGDWNIRILDNDFSGELRPGKSLPNYLNTGLDVFYNQEFYLLKAAEKLMTMLYIKISGVGSPNYHVGTEHFYEKYTRLFGVQKRTLQNYLTGIRRFFAIGIKNREYWISPLRRKVKKENAPTDRSERVKQACRSICRRFRLQEAGQAVSSLMEKYVYNVRIDPEPYFEESIVDLLSRRNYSTDPKRWTLREINIKYLHKIFREHLPDAAIIY